MFLQKYYYQYYRQLAMNKTHNYFRKIKTMPNEHNNIFQNEITQLNKKLIKTRI